jgi:Xaa-Pro aminopeptidase
MKRFAVLVLLVVLAGFWPLNLAGQMPPYGGQAAYLADLAQRRARTMAGLGSDSALVLWSAPPRVYSADTDYEYRQDSNLLYLTGIDQQDTTLVLVPGAAVHRVLIFVRAADPFSELWNGHILAPQEVTATSGIADVFPQRGTEAFDACMQHLLGGTVWRPADDAAPIDFGEFATAVRENRARLGILDTPDRLPDDATALAHVQWAQSAIERTGRVRLFSAASLINSERAIKTPYEQRVLRHSVEISAEAHVQGMKAARPGRWEYEVEAAIEYWFHRNGALSWGYPSIVASGPNATTLHYEKSTRQMQDGDLLLVDAAGDFQGLTGDITRTYPVNGRFTADQRALYEAVLRAQEAGMAAARPGSSALDITRAVRASFGADLLKLGLVTDPAAKTGASAQIDLWFPHGPTHGIGMDVHDPLGTLDPGAAFVIEPGLYIRQDTFDRLAADPAQADFVRALRPAFERFVGMGVRVEDSFLMTADGPEMLSKAAPRHVDAIERVVGTGP